MKQFLTILATMLLTAFITIAGINLVQWDKGSSNFTSSLFSRGSNGNNSVDANDIARFEDLLADEETTNSWSSDSNRVKQDDVVICTWENKIPQVDPITWETECIDAEIVDTECVWLDGEVYELWDTKEQFQLAYKTTQNPRPVCNKATFTCVNGLYVSAVSEASTYNRSECIVVEWEEARDEDVTCQYKWDVYVPWEVVYSYVHPKVEKTNECRFVWFYCNGVWERVSPFDQELYEFEECVFTEALDEEYIETYAQNLIQRWVLVKNNQWALVVNTSTFKVQWAWEWCVTPWDEKVDHGESVLSFEEQTWWFEDECVVRTSLCEDGEFVELQPFPYPTCKIGVPSSCDVNGYRLYHGTTQTFYNRWSTTRWVHSCDSQDRTCTDWDVDWDNSYIYRECEPREASPAPVVEFDASRATCPSPFVWWWASRRADQTWVGYTSWSVEFGSSCTAVNLVCKFWTIRVWSVSSYWSPTSQKYHTSCSEGSPNWCTFDFLDTWDEQVAHWWSVSFYAASSVAFWQTCSSVAGTATCTDWVLSTKQWYKNCTAWQPVWCTSSCGSVDHGQTLTTYNFATLPYSPWLNSCTDVANAVVRSTCSNWSLSPTPTGNCSCTIQAPAGCSNGMQHGQTITRVNDPWCSADEFGNALDWWANSACACKFWSITCTNWQLNRTANYPWDWFPQGSCN